MNAVRRLCVLLPMALVLLASSVPASALKPEVTEYMQHIDDSSMSCGAFNIHFLIDVQFRAATHFDQKGNIEWIQYHDTWHGIVANAVTDFTIGADAQFTGTYFPALSMWVQDGRIWHLTVPGKGLVLIEGGHDIQYGGPDGPVVANGRPHDLTNTGYFTLTPLCVVLA